MGGTIYWQSFEPQAPKGSSVGHSPFSLDIRIWPQRSCLFVGCGSCVEIYLRRGVSRVTIIAIASRQIPGQLVYSETLA